MQNRMIPHPVSLLLRITHSWPTSAQVHSNVGSHFTQIRIALEALIEAMKATNRLRFYHDTGCTCTPLPNEFVEFDSGPMWPLTNGAREFSVTNGEYVPGYRRAFMWARGEQDKPGSIQADVSLVSKPLAVGSSFVNKHSSILSNSYAVLVERDSWFGNELLNMFIYSVIMITTSGSKA